jgi:hypothetical protein
MFVEAPAETRQRFMRNMIIYAVVLALAIPTFATVVGILRLPG